MVTALYRRYRPETFSEMIGQSQVTEPLMTAIRAGKLGHAYLFSGPRGCGKTTSARVLARCLNCHQGPTDTPCGKCPSCVELGREGGGSLDVIEIDAASHGGVDDARELRERAVFAPARDRYKIFIIDEAHMVTKEGFNALLKIVEEPPAHVKFIFATTEPEKVIGTIRSRTHLYPFRLVAPAPLISYLEDICAREGAELEPGVLALVTRAGGGSVRDTLSILDQLIAGSEAQRVSLQLAVGILGYTPEGLLDDVLGALGDRDAARVVASVDSVVQTGQDPRRFVEDLLERLRDLIIVQATGVEGAAAVLRGLSDGQLERLFAQSALFTRAELSQAADLVSESLDHMVGATAPQLQLELMVARVLTQLDQDSVQSPVKKAPAEVNSQENGLIKAKPAPTEKPASLAKPAEQDKPVSEAKPDVRPDAAPDFATAAMQARAFLSRENGANSESGAKSESKETPKQKFDTEGVNDFWLKLTERFAAEGSAAHEIMQKISVIAAQGESLTIGFHAKEDLGRFKELAANQVRTAIETHFGVKFNFLPRLVEPKTSEAVIEPEVQKQPESGVQDQASPAEPADEPESPPASAPKIERYGEPIVRELLGAKFIKEVPLNENEEV